MKDILFKWIMIPSRPSEKWFLIWQKSNSWKIGGWLVVERMGTFPEFVKEVNSGFKDAVEVDLPSSLMLKRIIKDLFEGELEL